MILERMATNAYALLGFGELIVNMTGVKQPLVWIMENACLEGIILEKLFMNVNALLDFREMLVKPTVDMTLVDLWRMIAQAKVIY